VGAAQRFALAANGRDAEQARKRNSAEALNLLVKRAGSHLLAAGCVGQRLLIDAHLAFYQARSYADCHPAIPAD
jgi:hypothetical protein